MRFVNRMSFVACAAFVLGIVLSASASVQAATLTVNSVADVTADDGQCTLREAITAANTDAASGAASGECVAGSGTDTIDINVTGTITLTSVLPDLTTNLTISNTQASGVMVQGNNTFRIFRVVGSVTVGINNLTISNGNATSDYGGGIRNAGTLSVTNSTFSGNSAVFYGGGIHNDGILTVTNSTFSGNSAAQYGGGIMNFTSMTVTNSTFSGNSAGLGYGAGIFNNNSATLSNSTISGNNGSGGCGNGIYNGNSITLSNTIVALNTGSASPNLCGGTFTSGGYNLIGNADGSSGFTNGVNNDQVGSGASPIDPLLGPLQNNGGPTLTRALLAGSPAIDRGNSVLTTDQRGFTRPIDDPASTNGTGNLSDIGAFEFNAPPQVSAAPNPATTNEDTGVLITLTGTDANGDTLTFAITAAPTSGTLGTISTPVCTTTGGTSNCTATVTYTPNSNFNGPDAFTFQASDGSLTSNSATVTINVTAVNDAPLAFNDGYTVDEDAPLTVTAPGVLANDTDVDASTTLSANLLTVPSNGSLVFSSNGSFTYTPNSNFNGPDTFTYQASDGTLTSNSATVTINVTAVNDTPLAINDSYTVDEDTTLVVAAAQSVLVNDTDADTGATLSAILVTGPTGGTLTLNANGSFTYTPTANFNGPDTFTYRASDGTASSNTATVTINVTAVNDAPAFTVTPTAITVDEDFSGTQTVTVTPATVPANEAGQTITYSLSPATVSFANVSFNVATGLVSITATANASGTQTFTITANDGQGVNNTAMQTFTLTVTAVNDAPVAVNDSYSTPTNAALTVPAPGVLTNDTDVDSTSRTAVLVTTTSNGTLTLNADGSFNYTPNLDFNGIDSFTYQASDGTASSNTATVQIMVNSGGTLEFSAASYTVNEQDSTAIVTVLRGGDSTQSVTVNYATSSTDATAGVDYTATSGTLVFAAGVTSQQFTVPILEDTISEATETITLTLSVPTTGAILGPQSTATLTITDNDVANTVQFDAASFSEAESVGSVTITVTRSGDTSTAATVDYGTTPDPQVLRCDVVNGLASERCDYVTTVGILRFAAGQATANITIPIIDDAYAEGGETFQLSLSNAVGVSLGAQATATLTIQDNDDTSSTVNPIDDLPTFVRQQYLDFLSREPDPGGFDGWMAKLNQCPPSEHGNRDSAQDCTRIDVSSAFFRSLEFGLKGDYVYRFYQVSFEEMPQYAEFIRDMSRIKGATDEELAANRAAFPGEWVTRARFQTKYDALANAAYVDELLRTSGMTQSLAGRRGQWVSGLDAGTQTRAQVLMEIVESPEVEQQFYNESFVAMQYFGYLRRDPDQAGYDAWLEQLNRTGNYRVMVWGFLYSPEYKLRFGPVPGF
ncbi:MAG: tandem-95 repeat protein [Pyrinomonadaceae bacterium]|nr:tandem-95 repeat protein [Pyrinomonadaceae bacterium]